MRAAERTEHSSPTWAVFIAAIVIVAVASGAIAIVGSIRANRFIGEGDLLFDDTALAAARVDALSTDDDLQTELRRIRNRLEIEAVAYKPL